MQIDAPDNADVTKTEQSLPGITNDEKKAAPLAPIVGPGMQLNALVAINEAGARKHLASCKACSTYISLLCYLISQQLH